MAGLELGMVTNQLFSGLPFLVIGLIGIMLAGAYIAFKQRIGPFYWMGAIRAPDVRNYEGGRFVKMPGGDMFRILTVGDVKMIHSRQFDEKFPAGKLLNLVEFAPVGKKQFFFFGKRTGTEVFRPLARAGREDWRPVTEIMNEPAKVLEIDMERKTYDEMQNSFVVGKTVVEGYKKVSTLEQYMGVFSYMIVGAVMLVAILAITQWFGSQMAAINASNSQLTAAVLQLVNATLTSKGIAMPTPQLPPAFILGW